MRSTTVVMASVGLFLSGMGHAMPVQVFDRMSDRDQTDYEVYVLLAGAEKVLAEVGRADQVEKIKTLFTTRQPGDDNTMGMVELELNIAAVTKADADNFVKNPDARPLAIELAMIATLKANGIILPKTYMHVGDDFEPKNNLSPPPKFGPFAQCFGFRHGTCVDH